MREADQIIKVNGKSLPVFNSPFTQNDYDSIISMRHTYDEFGVMDNSTGKFKVYDFEKAHIPNINYLWNVDFSFFKSVKILGLGLATYYAYRIATFRPKLPSFSSSFSELNNGKLKDMFPFTNPNTLYQGGTSEEE